MSGHAFAFAVFAGNTLAAVSTVDLPSQYPHGSQRKISTALVDPHTNRTIEVVVDQGSENFWVFGPDSISNWGCRDLGCQGPCNVTVQPFYDYPNSPTASEPVPHLAGYAYGSNSKIIEGHVTVNDSLLFVSDSGVSSTIDIRQGQWCCF
ncbi:hypothetical protein BDW02DRAFT_569223 [Decorospora gaudefroyi]|uniref:Peptidase A1 domain-containing protein n=1 Tax=Decorospora gaudefroyi TaxID=184978 RepID=A0A6A5KIP7_9PLEO|nr:hypothetical protein BDW02DRAFT_569223 [Decorospora gaudefroyi]